MSTKSVHRSTPPKSTDKKAAVSPLVLQGMAVAFLFVLGLVLYQPILQHRFLDWDDQLYVTENPLVLTPDAKGGPSVWNTPIALNYHPLTIISLQWDRMRAGDQLVSKQLTAPFLQTNRFLHALNSCLVFFFLLLLTRKRLFPSFFAALVFLVHPMHVESVAWISERKDVLYTFFFLGAASAYLLFLRKKAGYWWVLSFLLFVLSCGSKAMAVSLVPVLFLLDWWEKQSLASTSSWLNKIPFILTALLVGILAMDIQAGGNGYGLFSNIEGVKAATGNASQFGFLERIQYATYGMTQYLYKFFLPFDLSPFYPYPEASINRTALPFVFPLSAVLFAAVAGASAWSIRSTKVYFFAFAFYFFTVVLVSQFLSVGLVIMADRYSYLPYLGVAFGLGWGLDQIFSRIPSGAVLKWVIAGLFCSWLSVLTREQLLVWRDTESLWKKALQQYPKDGQVLANLGNYYGKNGRIEEAASCFERAVEAKIQNAMVYEGLGNVYGAKGEHQKAAEMFSEAIRIDPKRGNFYFNRGTAYAMFAPEKAIPDFEKALELLPPAKHAEVLVRIANTYLQQKDYEKAIVFFDQSIALGTPTPSVLHDRGVAKFNSGRREEGIADFKAAIQLDPQFQLSINTLRQLGAL